MKMLKFVASAVAAVAVSCAGMAQTQTVRLYCADSQGSDLSLKVTGEGAVHVRWAEGVENDYSQGVLQGKCYEDTITITLPRTITGFDCDSSSISWLDVSGAPALTSLNCAGNRIAALNVDGLAQLDELQCSGNDIKSLSVATNGKLRYLDCADNQIESLNLGECPLLEVLSCSGNPIASLDLSRNDALRGLWSMDCGIESLDLSLCRNLNTIVASHGKLASINLGPAISLEDLWLDHNCLSALDLKGTNALVNANLSDNELESLDLRELSTKNKISYFNCGNNHLPFSSFLPYNKVTEYVGGAQDNVYCGYDSLAVNELTDFAELITNAGGTKIGILTAFDAKTGNELEKGGNGKDYQYLIGRVRFWHEIDSVYFVVTSTRYTDLEIRTNAFVVYDPEATAIHSATTETSPNSAQWDAENGLRSSLFDLFGRRVATPQRGKIYIHNGKKIVY